LTSLFARLQQEIDDRARQDGMSMFDLLELPPELSRLVLILARKGQMPADDLAAAAEVPPDELARLMDALVDRGLVRGFDLAGQRFYRTYFGRRRQRGVGQDFWTALDDRTSSPPDP
jgi:hypothetical protein